LSRINNRLADGETRINVNLAGEWEVGEFGAKCGKLEDFWLVAFRFENFGWLKSGMMEVLHEADKY